MHTVKKTHSTLRYSLLSLAILGITPAAHAQVIQAKEEADEQVEVIEVTGSRIRRTELETHTPVVSIGSSEIEKTGAVNISDLLNELPSMAPAGGTETSNSSGYAGLSRQDLRGLGSTRTLVLVNGRRHVPSVPGSSEVDVGSIPTALIERVDVLTGGASSVYGADAVSGVVNIILKKDFTGSDFNASYSVTGEGDGDRWYGSLTHGQAFEDGKGSYNFHLGYQTSEAVEGSSRPYIANDLTYITNPAANEPGQPTYITGNRSPLYASNNRIFLINGRPYTLNPDGSARAILADGQKVYGTSKTQLAALTVDSGTEGIFTRYEYARLAVPVEQLNTNFNLRRDLSDSVQFSTELKYVTTKSESRTEPLADYGTNALPVDYSFYTPEQLAEVERTGAGLRFGGYFPEMGRQGTDYKYDLYQAVFAFEGLTQNNARWQASAQHGQTKIKMTSVNDYNQSRWDMASQGSGWYFDTSLWDYNRCTGDCVPINVFQPLTQEAINYLKIDDHSSHAKMTQTVLMASLDGDLFELPAGYVGYAVGAEHRREKTDNQPSDVILAGTGAYNYTAKPLVGDYNVSEAFVELRAPVITNTLLAKSLEVNAAWRTANYSTAGTNHSWTVGLDWMPFDDLKIRASRAKAARAPNINEIYQSESQFWNYVYEVCYSSYRKHGSEYREANCNARGLTDPDNYYSDALIITSGSKDLKAERAYTLTTGFVYSPSVIDNLSLTVDYWDINLVDKIGTLYWSQVYPNCMDSPSLDNVFCDLITYHSDYTQLNMTYLNLAQHKTRGIDYALSYQFDAPVKGMQMALNSNWSRLIQRDLQSDPTAAILSTLGELSFPKWRGRNTLIAWTDNYNITLAGHYIGSQVADINGNIEDYSVAQTGSLWYLDLGLGYNLTKESSVNLYISNITDRKTPQVPGASTGGANWEMGYSAGLYTTLGRYITLSYNHKF